MNMRLVLAVSAAALVFASPATAAVSLSFSGTNDAAFEGPGGYLNAVRGLPLVSGSALIPIERAVGEVRGGGTGQRTRALHLPTAGTGLPVADGGTGITVSLTAVGPWASANAGWTSGALVPFSVSRTGNIVNFTVGTNSFTSDARASLLEINAFELRARTTATSSFTFSDLLFSDSLTAGQALPSVTASAGGVEIRLWEGITGDFRLTGNLALAWTTPFPGGSAFNAQVKLLTLPAIPEPGTWAMMIAGFGLVGAAMRRRRLAVA